MEYSQLKAVISIEDQQLRDGAKRASKTFADMKAGAEDAAAGVEKLDKSLRLRGADGRFVSTKSGLDGVKAGADGADEAAKRLSATLGDRLRGALDNIEKRLAQTRARLQEIAADALKFGATMSAALTLPLLGAAKMGAEFVQMKQSALIAFETMLGSADKAKKMFADLEAFAAATPFDLPDVVHGTQRLVAMGFAAKDAIPLMRVLGDTVAAVGGDATTLERIALAVGQIRNSGTLKTQDINQLVQAGIPVYDILVQKLHKSVAQIRKDMEKGAIDSSTAITAILTGLDQRFGGTMGKMGNTWAITVSNLKDVASQSLGTLFEPAIVSITSWVQTLTAGIGQIRDYLSSLSEETRIKIAEVVAILAAIGPATLAIAGIATLFEALLSPIGLVVTALAALAIAYVTNLGGFKDTVDTVLPAIGSAFVAWIPYAMTAVEVIWNLLKASASGLGILAGVFWDASKIIVKALRLQWDMNVATWNAITGLLSDVISFFGRGMTILSDTILSPTGALQGLADVFRTVFEYIDNLTGGAISNLVQRFQGLFDALGMAVGGVRDTASSLISSIQVGVPTALSAVNTQVGAMLDNNKARLDSFTNGFKNAWDKIGKLGTSFTMPKLGNITMPAGGGAATDDKAAKKLENSYNQALHSIGLETAKLEFQVAHLGQKWVEGSKVAEMTFELQSGKLRGLRADLAANLLAEAKRYDQLKLYVDLMKDYTKKADAARQAVALGANATDYQRAAYEFAKQSLDGLSEAQRAHVLQAQQTTLAAIRDAEANRALGKLFEQQAMTTFPKWKRALIDAAGGLKVWNDLSDPEKNKALKAFQSVQLDQGMEQLRNVSKDYGRRAADGLQPFTTTLTEANRQIADMIQQIPALGNSDAAKKLFETIRGQAKQIDLQAGQKQIKDWSDGYALQIDTLKAKLGGMYDPAKAAVADWELQNRDAIAKLLATVPGAAALIEALKGQIGSLPALTIQEQTLGKFNAKIADLQQQFLQLTAASPFEAFKASMMELDEASGKLVQRFSDKQLKQMFDLQQFVDVLAEAADGMESVFTNAFENIGEGLGGFFRNIVQGVEQMLQEIAAKFLARKLTMLAITAIGSAFGVDLSELTGSVDGARADGGPVDMGRSYLVGERGPEIFTPSTSGRVLANGQGGSESAGNTVIIKVMTQDAQSFSTPRSQSQLRAAAYQAGQAAFGKNG